MKKTLKTKDVAEKLGYSVHYFRAEIMHAPDFPKPIVIKKSNGGHTQPKLDEKVINDYLEQVAA